MNENEIEEIYREQKEGELRDQYQKGYYKGYQDAIEKAIEVIKK